MVSDEKSAEKLYDRISWMILMEILIRLLLRLKRGY